MCWYLGEFREFTFVSKAAHLYNDTVVIVVVKVFVLRALKSKENRQELKDLRLDYYCNMDLEFGRKASSIQPCGLRHTFSPTGQGLSFSCDITSLSLFPSI